MDKDCPRRPAMPGGQPAVKAAPMAKVAARPGPGKGKAGGKGGGKNQFQGTCNHCGRWGHQSTTCRVVMALQDAELAESIN
eukprot:14641579-Heterocapsa_arctica.AAC.1